MTDRVAVCLMGPTASGKTDYAIRLAKRLPVELVSVDSALVYRGMDIGTAKPDAETLRRFPHRLVDIRDPEDTYSAGEFVDDVRAAIDEITAAGHLPILVGGTMMYFRALTAGIAQLPAADAGIRAEIDRAAADSGWPALHEELQAVDAAAAERINPNDSQRIQRALEVYRLSGVPLTEWQRRHSEAGGDESVRFLKLGLTVDPRSLLHERIQLRLNAMFNNGFEDEVRSLISRPLLTREHASMRSVGYRQVWEYLAGESSRAEAADRALFATRQLAKRQITWMRSDEQLECFDALDSRSLDTITARIRQFLG